MPEQLLAVGCVGGFVACVAAAVGLLLWRIAGAVRAGDQRATALRAGAVARAAPDATGTLRLAFAVPPGNTLDVWLYVDVVGGDEEDRLRMDLAVDVDGVEQIARAFPLGEEASSPFASGGITAIATRGRPTLNGSRLTSTMRLLPVPVAPPGTPIVVRGTIAPGRGATLKEVELFASAVAATSG